MCTIQYSYSRGAHGNIKSDSRVWNLFSRACHIPVLHTGINWIPVEGIESFSWCQVATCPTSPIASDANDILNHSFFLPRSLHMIFTCDIYIPLLLTPPSCVYRFLWERTVSIIFTHLISPFLFTPFIYLEGLYHGQSEPEVDLYLSTLPVRVHTHTYTYIYIFLSRLEICEC